MSLAKSILFCALLAFAADASAVTMSWSFVGNPGNANDTRDGDQFTTGIQNFGAVPYAFNIGRYDVTANQYTEFLNAKDPTGANALGLYSTRMSDFEYGEIQFNSGNTLGSKYITVSGRENYPANYVTWYDTIRFANWMNNGQGSADTETGAYTLGTLGAGGIPIAPPLTHNAGSSVWLPTENEWYKAAYYNPSTSSYFLFGTSSSATPISSYPSSTLPNHANVFGQILNTHQTNVGAFSGTTSPYGAFDMTGNVFQWNELQSGVNRGARGGAWDMDYQAAVSQWRGYGLASLEYQDFGFRLASAPGVPEPSTLALAAFGFTALAAWGWRRRKR